ncbi:cytochrome P450 family protein [Nocardia vinacea]|uniref:cytochrome P450 family protein n=1 Tax=Nocardia vinacea TaxID=96468 RepID=UPI0002E24B1D|nr:cytochrome P450 [Nocardia vinacea]
MRKLPQDFFRTPYAFYEGLRAEGPVHPIELNTGVRAWLVVDLDVAREVLRHPAIRKDPRTDASRKARGLRIGDTSLGAVNTRISYHLLNTDPPGHARLRRLVAPAFAPARIEVLAPRVLAIADELLDRIAADAAGPVDLLSEYAFPLPITVICELLGVPVADRADFREWSRIIVELSTATPEEIRHATDAIADYFEQLITRRRAEGLGADLVSDLIAANADGDRLTDDELISMVFLILVAGHETTVNLIGNTVLTLLSDPPRYRALHGNTEAVPALIEEMLRYDGPVNVATLRYTTEPLTLGGIDIPAGEMVLVALGSANHDERHFSDAAEFDPQRSTSGHLAFGHGIHYCLGAGLARLEARIAITRLVEQYPDLRLAADGGELRWRESMLIRGLQDLPVELAGAPALR